MWFLFFIKRRNKNNRITHSTLKRKIDIQTTKLRTENKISKQKMIMSANKNNHNRSACKIFMSKNNPSKMQACFFKARKSRFCYRLSSPIKPRNFFVENLPLKPIHQPLCIGAKPFLKSNLKFYFCPK